jgi:exopolysaccharide biosynthesis WecB/TagA/CpsF family protein
MTTLPAESRVSFALEEVPALAGVRDPVAAPSKRSLFGVNVSATCYNELVDFLVHKAKRREPALVGFAPANIIVEAASNLDFQNKLNDFDVVCPDGHPVRWCLNHFHKTGLTDRVYGPATTMRLCEAAVREGLSVYFYGASPSTIDLLCRKMKEILPDLRIAGAESPPFRKLTEQELIETADRINATGANFLFIGTGSVKQETFAWLQRDRIRSVQLCVGAAFDFIAGTKPSAPPWMQKRGLEWLYRLCKEPKRLGRRYFVTNTLFICYALRTQLQSLAGQQVR